MLSLSIPTLETERLILRAHREEDFRAEAEFYATDASRFVGGPQPEHRTWRMLAMMVGHWAFRGFGFWALEEKNHRSLHGPHRPLVPPRLGRT